MKKKLIAILISSLLTTMPAFSNSSGLCGPTIDNEEDANANRLKERLEFENKWKVKSGLTLLKSTNLAEDFFDGIKQLFQHEGLDHNWFPVLGGIKDECTFIVKVNYLTLMRSPCEGVRTSVSG
jgi:hypothetical protein